MDRARDYDQGENLQKLRLWRNPTGWRAYVATALLLSLSAGGIVLVYLTGGTQFTTPYLLFIPVLLFGFVFGLGGLIFSALAIGLALGPLMPLNVEAGTMQSPINWLARIGYLGLIGGVATLLFTLLDRHQNTIQRLIDRDPLTGLLRGNAIDREVSTEMENSKVTGQHLIFLAIDLRGLHLLTSVIGHRLRDDYLQHIARRTRAAEGTINCFRLETGMFGVCYNSAGADSALQKARDVLAAVREPAVIDGIPFRLDVAAGIAVFPTHATDADALHRSAISAATSASLPPHDVEVFNPDLDQRQREMFSLIQDLRIALSEKQLRLHYQPKIDLRSGRCVGAEGLLRWEHPKRGNVSPALIFEAVERTDLMPAITNYVIDLAITQFARWELPDDSCVLAVNISAHDLEDVTLPKRLRRTLDFHGFAPKQLQLEVTETAIMKDRRRAHALLKEIREMGTEVAIDDFGTGQSSLAYLVDLPFDVLKVDQTFARKLSVADANEMIIRSAVQLTRELHRIPIVEGIETADVATQIRDLGCDYGQGYHFAKPMPADEFPAWWHHNHKNPHSLH